MNYTLAHTNFNVFDLEKSVSFYKEALGLKEVKRSKPDDGSFELVFMTDDANSHQIELTWLRDRDTPYDLSDNEIHLALIADDFDAAYKQHKQMDCICYENTKMGLYFIEDPDGYWIEIVPNRRAAK